MRKTLKYFFSIFFMVIAVISVHGQKGTIMPSAVRIGTDLGFLGVSIFDPEKQLFEISADVDVYKLFLTADYGMVSWKFNGSDFEYDNSGSYFKVGVDYNLGARDPDLNVIYFGMKYAGSSFSEKFYYTITDPFFYDYSENIDKSNMSAYWIEANFGMKVRVWKQLFLGWAGRIKFARKVQSSNSSFETFFIPGYGKAAYDTRYGFNFQVFYRIPFREKPPYKPKKIKENTKPEGEPVENEDPFGQQRDF
jgi:hypothetical protein